VPSRAPKIWGQVIFIFRDLCKAEPCYAELVSASISRLVVIMSIFCQQKMDEKTVGGIVDFVLVKAEGKLFALKRSLPLWFSFPRFAPNPGKTNNPILFSYFQACGNREIGKHKSLFTALLEFRGPEVMMFIF